uniref:Uncharacterized protein n=1 Tax=Cacopsylla melanoneura TaxID=428564 RepID=A0A8D9E8C5_9HEMI
MSAKWRIRIIHHHHEVSTIYYTYKYIYQYLITFLLIHFSIKPLNLVYLSKVFVYQTYLRLTFPNRKVVMPMGMIDTACAYCAVWRVVWRSDVFELIFVKLQLKQILYIQYSIVLVVV